jgi:uncharacterized paraquat-inducible protein A
LSVALTGYFLRPLGPVRRVIALLSGLLLCLPADAFPSAGFLLAAAAAVGTILVGIELVVRPQSGSAV